MWVHLSCQMCLPHPRNLGTWANSDLSHSWTEQNGMLADTVEPTGSFALRSSLLFFTPTLRARKPIARLPLMQIAHHGTLELPQSGNPISDRLTPQGPKNTSL